MDVSWDCGEDKVNKYIHILQLGLLTYKHVYSGVWNLLCKWHVDTGGGGGGGGWLSMMGCEAT